MIQIEHLRMRLPAGFEHRATRIAGLLGDMLAQQSVSNDISLETVSIAPLRISAVTDDAEIAQIIARQIISATRGGQ